MTRKVHLVGTLPAGITEKEPADAWAWVREHLGGVPLTTMPFDDDPRWLVRFMQDLEERGVIRAVQQGDFSGYDAVPVYRFPGALPNAPQMRDATRMERARALLDAYDRLGLRGAPVQLSRPNPLDTGLMTFVGRPDWRHPLRTVQGIVLLARQSSTLRRAAELETRDAAERARELDVPVVWQVETVTVLYALNTMPKPLRRTAARLLARQVAGVLRGIPDGAAMLHVCYGSLADTELVAPRDTQAAVMFLNALAERLTRAGKPLPAVHVPFAYGSQPPPGDPDYYAPLGELDRGWPLIAGVVDERDPAASRHALELVERHAHRQVKAVATACGMGRRSVTEAERALALAAELAKQ